MQPASLQEEFYEWRDNTLILNVLGTPNAKQDKILKPKGTQLKISVKKEPEDGKATEYMIRFLSCEFGVHNKEIELVYGLTTPSKQFHIKNPKKLPSFIKRVK